MISSSGHRSCWILLTVVRLLLPSFAVSAIAELFYDTFQTFFRSRTSLLQACLDFSLTDST